MAECSTRKSENFIKLEIQDIEVSVEKVKCESNECLICVTQNTECKDIHNTNTNLSGTPLYEYLLKFTNTNLLYCQSYAKHICNTCLNLVNDLEKAELEYLTLKDNFELIISNNPLFNSSKKPENVDQFESLYPDDSELQDQQEFHKDGENTNYLNTSVKLEPVTEDDQHVYPVRDDLVNDDDDSDYYPKVNRTRTAARGRRKGAKAAGLKDGATRKRRTVAKKHITDNKIYECTDCQRTFTQKGNYNRHMTTHTGVMPFQCPTCDRRFNRKDHLLNHIRTHTGEKPYECNFCLVKFNQKGSIIKHLRTHTGAEPFECNQCSKRFKQRPHLNSHLRTHTGEKPYECHYCRRKFAESSKLKIHLRIHTGVKPYKCQFCAREFNQSGNLQCHLRTHTNEKPYECSMCDKRFNLKHHLRDHIRNHTGEKPYNCHVCEQKFNYRHIMEHHVKVMHPGALVSEFMDVVDAEPEIEIMVNEDEVVSLDPQQQKEV